MTTTSEQLSQIFLEHWFLIILIVLKFLFVIIYAVRY